MNVFGQWLFIEVGDVVALHREMLAKYGGQDSPPKNGCVDSSVGSAITAAMYETDQDDPDLLCAVAYLLVYLAKNHCFVDGNKRVAWSAAVRTFDLNGIHLRGDDPEAAPLVNRVATGTAGVADVMAWLGHPDRLREAHPPPKGP